MFLAQGFITNISASQSHWRSWETPPWGACAEFLGWDRIWLSPAPLRGQPGITLPPTCAQAEGPSWGAKHRGQPCTGLDLGGGKGKLEQRETLGAEARATALRGGAPGPMGPEGPWDSWGRGPRVQSSETAMGLQLLLLGVKRPTQSLGGEPSVRTL